MGVLRYPWGNPLLLRIPLTVERLTVTGGAVEREVEDFYPAGETVDVVFQSGARPTKLVGAVVDGHYASVDASSLGVGDYSIEIFATGSDGLPYRFKQASTLVVVDLTAMAGVESGVEFIAQQYTLDASVYQVIQGPAGRGIDHTETVESDESGGANVMTFYYTDGTVETLRVLNGRDGSGGISEETDPVFSASPAAGITQEDIDNWDSKYDKPSTGIPKTDLASDVQTSLGKADTAVQPEQGKGLFSGSYDDLSNKPTIPAAQVQSDWNASSGMGEILNKPELADVATSGSYNDLEDTPDNLSDFNNDMGFARNIYGRLTNGSFYKGTYSGGQWIYKNTAVTPETGVLYIDVADNVSYVWSGSAFVRVDEEQTETPSVTVSATGNVSQALNPNTFYSFGAVDSLDLTLVAGTGLVVYFGRFSTSANWGGTGLTVPSGVTEGANNPTVEASKTYEFNIMDNVLLLMEV